MYSACLLIAVDSLLLGISMIGTAEAMLLGTRLGLEPSLLASILNSSTGKCWSSEVNNPMAGSLEKTTPADREYAPGLVRFSFPGIHILLYSISIV